MLFIGLALGFVAGSAATLMTMFIASHLQAQRTREERRSQPESWDMSAFEATSDFPACH